MTDSFSYVIRQRARAKEANRLALRSEKPLRAPSFAEWALIDRRIKNVRDLGRTARNELYADYQEHMISMGFKEWDCAKFWGVDTRYNIFGR